jgi:Mn2+/Fe2+ NRAMP family transporter
MKQLGGIFLGILTATGGFLDAGTIATSAAAGATFGLGLVWAVVLGTLAIILLVEMSGRFAAVSGKGYAEGVRERFGFRFALIPMVADVISNAFLLAADIGGIAIGVSLLTGISWHILLPFSALLLFAMSWRAPFGLIENLPSIFGLAALAFIGGVFVMGGPNEQELSTAIFPQIKQGELASYLFLAAAILGATVSPYLVYFYSSGAREERWSKESLRLNKFTAVVGMGFGSLCSLGVLVMAAMILQPGGMSGQTLDEIGITLDRAFGQVGAALFALVLIAACLGAGLEIVLSIGYHVAQDFGWEWGEEKKPVQAARFNLILTIYLIASFVLMLIVGDPLQLALVGSAVVALVLPVALVGFIILMNDRDYVGEQTNGAFSNFATIGVIAVAFVVAVVSLPLLFLSGGG